MALANEDSPVYIAGGASVIASMYLDKDKLVAAMRGNGALSWADHHPCLFAGTERFFRPGYRANLARLCNAQARRHGASGRTVRQ